MADKRYDFQNQSTNQVEDLMNAEFNGTDPVVWALGTDSADEATNVTTNIGGKAISNIFESDGVTVKNATTADDSDKLDGKHWVEIANGSHLFSTMGTWGLNLKSSGQHNFYLISVYCPTDSAVLSYQTTANPICAYILRGLGTNKDVLYISNQSGSNTTVYYKVLSWE